MLHIRFKGSLAVGMTALTAVLLIALSAPERIFAQMSFLEQKRPARTEIGMGLLTSNPTRTVIDLNGEWRYRQTESEQWYSVNVPSSWKGTHRVVFKKEFNIPPSLYSSRAFQLVALSISNYCEISINGQFVGKHSGLTSFSFNVSPGILKPGGNVLEILVHNELNTKETLPPYEQLWSRMNYGGIVHDIALIARRGVWVQETYLKTSAGGEGKSGTVNYRVFLSSGRLSNIKGDSASGVGEFGRSIVNHQIEVLDPVTMQVLASSEAERLVVESDRLKEVQITITVPSVKLWSPESPNIYLLRQRTTQGATLLDESYVHVGFKNLQVRGTDIYLNGEKYFLKALTYMEDSPWHGRSLSIDEMERDVLLIKNLGTNAVRLFAGSVHPYFLSLCDKYGLLVFHEIPMTYAPTSVVTKKGILTTGKNIARELLVRDNWHPSFASIGIGQGLEPTTEGLSAYLRELSSSIKKQHEVLIHASFRGADISVEQGLIDIAGLDIPPSDEEQILAQIESIDAKNPGIPLIVSSLMYPVQIGNYNGYSDPRSIDAQGQFFLNLYRSVRQQGFAGITVHSFSDWAVSRPIMTVDRVHQFTGTAGIVDRYRQKRLAYDVLKASFNNEKPPVLVSGSHIEEHPVSFVVIGIIVIFLFALVYNVFRRFRENVVRSFLRPYNFYSDVRDKRMLSIFQTTMVGLLGAISGSLLFANLLFFWRTEPVADHLLAQLIHSVWMKQWINYAAWNPLENIFVTTVVLYMAMLLYTLVLRMMGILFRGKVLLFDAYSVAMWSVLPMIMLSPLGMILYRIMDQGIVEVIAAVLYLSFHLWIISRLLKGSAIVFDVRPAFFYIGGYTLILAGCVLWLYSLDSTYDFFAYLRYFATLWLSAGPAVS
jgi:beta-galactosidase